MTVYGEPQFRDRSNLRFEDTTAADALQERPTRRIIASSSPSRHLSQLLDPLMNASASILILLL